MEEFVCQTSELPSPEWVTVLQLLFRESNITRRHLKRRMFLDLCTSTSEATILAT